eukprot:7380067-Prymnesium_polylepis.3
MRSAEPAAACSSNLDPLCPGAAKRGAKKRSTKVRAHVAQQRGGTVGQQRVGAEEEGEPVRPHKARGDERAPHRLLQRAKRRRERIHRPRQRLPTPTCAERRKRVGGRSERRRRPDERRGAAVDCAGERRGE